MDDGDDSQGDHNPPAIPFSETENLEGMIDHVKAEHLETLGRGELWDANAMQSLSLNFLEEVRQSTGLALLARCREKIVEVFTDLGRTAIGQNRWETADRYRTMANLYGPDD